MKIISYKAFGHTKSTYLDKLIGITSFSKYSHTELVFSDGTCFSASGRDDGVRFKKFEPHIDRWDIYELDVTDEEEEHLKFLANLYIKKQIKYDYLGVVCCGLHLCLMNKRLFCSEIVAEMLSYIFDLKGFPCHYSPGKIVKYLESNPKKL